MRHRRFTSQGIDKPMVKTHWIIVSLGVWLLAAGAAALYFGLDLIGTERGSLYAIGGTVAVSGGLIVVSLGLALRRLELQVARLIERLTVAGETTQDRARPKLAQTADASERVPLEQARPLQPRHAASPSAPLPDAARSPPDFLLRPPSEGVSSGSTAPNPRAFRSDPLVDSMLAETQLAAGADIVAVGAPALEAVDMDAIDAEPVPPKPLGSMTLPRAVLPASLRPKPVAASEPHLHHDPIADAADPANDAARADAGSAEALAASPIVAHASPPGDPPHSGPQSYLAEPTVVGRYNAGGAAYTMYSDGAIEAETETGNYRFSSMKELREFIEQRSNLVNAPAD